MNDLFGTANLSMFGIILFAAFFVFLFNYRHDNKDKYQLGFLFGLTSNVSIPIILKMFAEQLQSRLKAASKAK